MTTTHNRTAVVTGAASGIGRALAIELASRGCRLAISDVDVDGLEATAVVCEERGGTVWSHPLDVTERDAFAAYAAQVEDRFGPAELVFNNAGITLVAWAHEQSLEDIDRVLDVNLHGVITGSQAFLPQIQRARGHLVNISSVFGIFAVPAQSAYHASKFGVRGYTEALAVEAKAAGDHWRVSCVHPGGIATDIVRSARVIGGTDHAELIDSFHELARTTPQEAAAIILRGVERDKRRIHVGLDAKLLHGLVRVAGSAYQHLVARLTDRIAAVQVPDVAPGRTPPAAASPSASSSHSSRTA